jgi:hypothetical protein
VPSHLNEPAADSRIRPSWSGAEKIVGAFVVLAVALALATPEDLYANSAAVRGFADWMANRIGAIHEFATVSDFPGTTRVVLAVLWALVVPLAVLLWLTPGSVRWNTDALRRAGLARLAALAVIAGAVIVPMVMHIAPVDLDKHGSIHAITRLVSSSRLALGTIGGLYCGATAFLLALVPRLLNPKYFW